MTSGAVSRAFRSLTTRGVVEGAEPTACAVHQPQRLKKISRSCNTTENNYRIAQPVLRGHQRPSCPSAARLHQLPVPTNWRYWPDKRVAGPSLQELTDEEVAHPAARMGRGLRCPQGTELSKTSVTTDSPIFAAAKSMITLTRRPTSWARPRRAGCISRRASRVAPWNRPICTTSRSSGSSAGWRTTWMQR